MIQQNVRYVCSTRISKNIYNKESRFTGSQTGFSGVVDPSIVSPCCFKAPKPKPYPQTKEGSKDRDMATPSSAKKSYENAKAEGSRR